MTSNVERIRLLDLEIAGGARQLATTEAIMNSVATDHAPATLRLYSWSEPVVVLGVGQPASDLDLQSCERLGHQVIRRIGGGTAVYHDEDEVSIDLIVPGSHELAPSDVHAGYRMFSAFLKQAFDSLGIEVEPASIEVARRSAIEPEIRPLCFGSISPYEFLANGKKMNGLCQIRRRNVIAYQTAIYRRFISEPLISSLRHESAEVRAKRESKLDELVTDLNTLCGESIDYITLQSALEAAAGEALGMRVERGHLSRTEETDIERLISEKYGNPEWTFRR